MIIVQQSADLLKRFIAKTDLNEFAQAMVMRIVLAFVLHRGRMSCSSAAGVIASQSVHRCQVTRFLRRPRWQKNDFNATLRQALLQMETGKGKFIFLIDATLFSQAGKKTENTFSTGNRKRRPKKGRRYNNKKVRRKNVHSFTFGLLITPSGYRIPFQIPHYTKEYCKKKGLTHLTTAEAAAKMIRDLPLDEEAEVLVLGDTAYDAKSVREACDERGYTWIFPANPERVYEGPTGQRPKLRSRLKDWTGLSLKRIRLRASTGKYAGYRRISRWRVGPKQKPREYFAYQEKREVRSVGRVQLVFSTMKSELKKATPDDVKILMTNATDMSVSEVIEAYSVRWQIELFFKELKSTLGVGQYQFEKFAAVEAWMNCAITTVLFLEQLRAKRLQDRRLSEERHRWWQSQRLHGLCEAFHQECTGNELKYLSDRLKTSGGIKKMQRLLMQALPQEFRVAV
ncbi:transposase [Neorhodopirellula pilleata]|uniref:Transposase DDE domain protein n=1 Tax=Neorhodopirellula pilleata TaxID=2714738 RepID=A0A5C5YQV4_9BACT|nr:transposase [Neorhodopirellula pilleata]TWT77188.1 Transposase DDE domain protein [Neorhodopirellula pilleata]